MTRTLIKCCCLTLALACLGLTPLGCASGAKTADVSPGAVGLCTHCGQVKGSEQCCRPGQETCAKCGLVKGSPGCCKIGKTDT